MSFRVPLVCTTNNYRSPCTHTRASATDTSGVEPSSPDTTARENLPMWDKTLHELPQREGEPADPSKLLTYKAVKAANLNVTMAEKHHHLITALYPATIRKTLVVGDRAATFENAPTTLSPPAAVEWAWNNRRQVNNSVANPVMQPAPAASQRPEEIDSYVEIIIPHLTDGAA